MKYFKQEADTNYCQLLACVNARAFYGLPNPNYLGRAKKNWSDIVEHMGAIAGPPTKSFAYIAHYFDLYSFPTIPALDSIKHQINRGRCVVAVTFLNDYHAFLITNVSGSKLTCVNYNISRNARTVQRIDWYDLNFKHMLLLNDRPHPYWAHFRVLLPLKSANSDVMLEASESFYRLLHEVHNSKYNCTVPS